MIITLIISLKNWINQRPWSYMFRLSAHNRPHNTRVCMHSCNHRLEVGDHPYYPFPSHFIPFPLFPFVFLPLSLHFLNFSLQSNPCTVSSPSRAQGGVPTANAFSIYSIFIISVPGNVFGSNNFGCSNVHLNNIRSPTQLDLVWCGTCLRLRPVKVPTRQSSNIAPQYRYRCVPWK